MDKDSFGLDVVGQVVFFGDGGHLGTEIYRSEDSGHDRVFRFFSKDNDTMTSALRVAIVRVAGNPEAVQRAENISEVCAYDLEGELMVLGLAVGALIEVDAEGITEVIWDSATDLD